MNKQVDKYRRYKKRIATYVDPILKDIFDKYCKQNKTNGAETLRVLLTEFLLESELVSKEDKARIINIDIIDLRHAFLTKYPVGINSNPDLQKRIIEIKDFEL